MSASSLKQLEGNLSAACNGTRGAFLKGEYKACGIYICNARLLDCLFVQMCKRNNNNTKTKAKTQTAFD